MKKVSGISNIERRAGEKMTGNYSAIETGLKTIMGHKYSDLFLLGFVVSVFGTLLVLSAIG